MSIYYGLINQYRRDVRTCMYRTYIYMYVPTVYVWTFMPQKASLLLDCWGQ
jgi:hypothetical protein